MIFLAKAISSGYEKANVLVAVEAGTELKADAVDETGNWLRVVANGVPGWINRETLGEVGELSLAEMPARIFWIWGQELDRHLAVGAHPRLFWCRWTIDLTDQRCQSPPQSFSRKVFAHNTSS